MEITKQYITGDELVLIDGIVEAEGWTPLPSTALALVAFDEKGMAGFHILQMRPHAEPLWIRPDLRGTKLCVELATEMKQFLDQTNTQGYIVIADTIEAAKLCESFGMKRITSPVYIK